MPSREVPSNNSPIWTSQTTNNFSDEQINSLIYIAQEEKLARDVYATLYEVWNIQKFNNILNSEINHQQQAMNILTSYNIQTPVIPTERWIFTIPELTSLYNELIEQWKISSQEAMNVGISIEQKDIQDIENMMKFFDDYPDILQVLQNLLDGSKRHLQAFQK